MPEIGDRPVRGDRAVHRREIDVDVDDGACDRVRDSLRTIGDRPVRVVSDG